MNKKGQLILGSALVILGLMSLISNIFKIDFSAVCWPTVLILLGAWLIWRPKFIQGGGEVNIKPLSNIHRSQAWSVEPEEIWMLVGDVHLDFTQAEIPIGETPIRIFGFVGSVTLLAPANVQISGASSAFLTDANLFGKKQERFVTTLRYSLGDDPNSERLIRLETFFFVCDLDLIRV